MTLHRVQTKKKNPPKVRNITHFQGRYKNDDDFQAICTEENIHSTNT